MEKKSEKHILIIDGSPPPHSWLLKRNYKVTWMREVDRLKANKGYFRKIGLAKNAPLEEWGEIAKTIHALDPIDKVLVFRDQSQVKASHVATKLNLEWHSLSTIESINNKYTMRKVLLNNGIPSVKFDKVNCLEKLKEIISTWNKPVIVKPLSTSGSMGIFKVNKIEEAENTWNQILSLGFKEAIVEELILGEEFSVESFTQNGKHHVLAITKKYKGKDNFVEVGHLVPAVLDSHVEKEIKDYMSRTLTALDIKFGMTHTELFVTSKGPIIVETHLRVGGDFIPTLVKESLNIDMIDIWMKASIEDVEYNPSHIGNSEYSAIWYKSSDVKGLVHKVENVEQAENSKGVIMVNLQKNQGDAVVETKDSASRLCFVIAKGLTPEEALTNAQTAVEKINYIIH